MKYNSALIHNTMMVIESRLSTKAFNAKQNSKIKQQSPMRSSMYYIMLTLSVTQQRAPKMHFYTTQVNLS